VLAGTCSLAPNDFYCPSSPQNLSAIIQLQASTTSVNFTIANADALFKRSGNYAFSNLGGPLGASYFDWGLPFFFGRSVFTVMEGKTVNTGSAVLNGPLNAFTN
jgi:hypothetical protein